MRLADTSAVTRIHVPAVVARLLQCDVVGRCSITDLEFGFSARNGDEYDERTTVLDQFIPVANAAEDFDIARSIQRSLAARSQHGRKLPDLLIAACAIRNDFTLLHYDHDFDLIATVSDLRHEWIVPAGSTH